MTVAKSIIQARHAAMYVANASDTFDAATSLNEETTVLVKTANIFAVKNLTITPPKSEPEVVNLSGETSQTIGAGVLTTNTFQNQVFDIKSWSPAKVTGTILLQHDEAGDTTPGNSSIQQIVSGAGTDITDAPAFTRWDFGGSDTGKIRDVLNSFGVVWNNGSGIMNCTAVNGVWNLGDIKMTGTDGHWEQDFEVTFLASDFVLEAED